MEILNVNEQELEEQDKKVPFIITDLAGADWVFRKIKQIKECFTHCIHAESMTPYFLEQFAKEVSKKKEEIKKWL